MRVEILTLCRGLMIDTARHYLSANTILRAIDAVAYNKVWSRGEEKNR